MTLKECYGEFGGDYNGVMTRMPGESFVAEFLRIFLEDESYPTLKAAMEARDAQTAFRAAHALKGICQNFGYTKLLRSSSALTELLRGGSLDGTEQPMRQVEQDYQTMVSAIQGLDAGI